MGGPCSGISRGPGMGQGDPGILGGPDQRRDSSSLARLDPKMQRRIGKVFRLLGCTMKARWLEGGTAKVWEVPKELREATVGTKEKLLRKAAAE